MIHLDRKISLEPFKSRLPGIIPAIMNNKLYTFGSELIKRENAYPSNYGMCPCSIVVPNNKEWSKAIYESQSIYNNWDENSNWNYKGKDKMIVSYRRLVTWYHFFENYYHLLMDYGSCGKIYSSATQYYDCETQGNSTGNLYYEGDREFYVDLDKKFKNLGGSFSGETNKDYNKDECEEYLINLKDTGFYNWICTNCIPRFIIPKQYKDEWNATHIFYPDAIKWAGWFAKYKDIEDCKKYSNCCDCEKFFRLGGIEMYKSLYDFVKNTREIADKWNTSGELTYIEEASTIRTQVSLQINVDDMGEMSPIEEEWEGGIDYGNGKENGGTVVRYNDDVYMLDSKKNIGNIDDINGRLQYGYSFDKEFLEYNFADNHWKDYTDYYIEKNKNEFKPSSEYFGFNENGQKVKLDDGTRTSRNNEAISISYNIERNGNLGYILIEDTPYEISKQEYIKYPTDGDNPYLRGRVFLVERYPITNTPYAIINKLTYISKDGKNFQFYNSNVPIEEGYFIFYKDILYQVSGGEDENANTGTNLKALTGDIAKDFKDKNAIKITIEYDNNGYEYPYIDGYITYNNEAYYVKGNTLNTSSTSSSSITTPDDEKVDNNSQESDPSKKKFENYIKTELEEVDSQDWGYNVIIDKDKEKYVVNIYPKNYTIYNAHYIEGKTESKLLDLQTSERTYDDLGNPLDGYYNFGNKKQNYAQPPEGEILEPLYQVGTVKNLTPIDSIVDGKHFCGDILYKMDFYYVDGDGNRVIFYDVDKDGNKVEKKYTIDLKDEITASTKTTTLSVIEDCKEEKEDIQKKYNEKYNAAINSDDKGKSLIEAVNEYQSFQDDIRCDVTYYMGATLKYVDGKGYELEDGYNRGVEYNETVVFKVKPQKYYLKEDDFYLVKVIVPEREETTIYSNTYDLQYNDNLASIKMAIDILGDTSNYNKEFKPGEGFAHNNNTIIEPSIRQEYKFGISSVQNVDSDIYIDRGINAAFEKHLKLGEVSTMESLTQYSNGFFKIMNS